MRLFLWLIPFLFSSTSVFSAESFFRSELLFPLQDQHVHSSTIVETPGGDILACWFQGSGERTAPDVVLQGARLRQGVADWSPVFPMADTPDIPDCNPVLYIDPTGELWLFWIAVPADRWEDSILRYRKSRDYEADGPPKWYWQDLIILKPGEKFVETLEQAFAEMGSPPGYGDRALEEQNKILDMAKNPSLRQKGWMTRTHLIQLPSGRILLPLYSDGYLVGMMAISDDKMKSWRAGSPIPGLGLNQPSVERKKDGTLVAYMRDEGPPPKRVLYSESKDDGETWSPALDLDIPNPNSSLEILALKDGRWVMVYNDTERGRHQLAIAMSEDEGTSWKWKRYLEKADDGQFHYPFVFQGRDGLIHVSYTYQPGRRAQKSIKHVALSADWIMDGTQ
ncbi:MAG: sialidase family protein [Acidobacteriota bacterium]